MGAFLLHGVLFTLFVEKVKSALFCLILQFTGGFFKVKATLVWLVSINKPYLLILLIAFTCSKGEVVANFITSR